MSETKIMVLKRKHIFLVCAVALALLVLILLLCFLGKNQGDSEPSAASYTAGVYQKELTIGEYPVTLTVTASSTHITGASLTYHTDAIETMYPLLPNALLHINEELAKGIAPEDITPESELRYTESYLLEAIQDAVASATPQ